MRTAKGRLSETQAKKKNRTEKEAVSRAEDQARQTTSAADSLRRLTSMQSENQRSKKPAGKPGEVSSHSDHLVL